MPCRISLSDGKLIVEDRDRLLKGRHHSQLALWDMRFDGASFRYTSSRHDPHLVEKVTTYLTRSAVPFEVSAEVSAARDQLNAERVELFEALRKGQQFKAAEPVTLEQRSFLDFLSCLPRRLKQHQVKAALHLLTVINGANFSVPGAGKTTVVLAVFEWLRQQGRVGTLFVVGPPACFGPWRDEYESVLGRKPSVEILAGGNIQDRQSNYNPSPGYIRDLYVTSFQTLQRDCELVARFFKHPDVRPFLVVDEAHYIKQLSGVWAEAVLTVTSSAVVRCLLTGTPFPQSYADAYNYFDVLWPTYSPIQKDQRIRITAHIQRHEQAEAGELLNHCIGPLFYRVRKTDLALAPQDFKPPILISMHEHERRIYEAIVSKIRSLAIRDDYHEFELLTRLRQGRMMRLRQCVSYAKLLGTAVTHYDENLLGDNPTISNTIRHYDQLERPAKLERSLSLVAKLSSEREKVVIWSNFVDTLRLLKESITAAGHRSELIYGGTPTETADERDELTREEIIKTFKKPDSGLDVLIANPAACAESISLHTACSHAIYYDLSYNCAQYLQSLDRIHRVGGSEDRVAHYYFLQYADTLDGDILNNVRRKAAQMSAIVDQDYPVYSLDMFAQDDELAAYERLFR